LLAPACLFAWRVLGGSSVPWVKASLLASTGFLLLWAPWWIRNAAIFGVFVSTTLNVGESLYDGLSPKANGASDTSFARDPEVQKLPEPQRDRIWRDRAVAYAKEHPRRVLQLTVVKWARFWSPWPNESRFRDWRVMTATGGYSLVLDGLAIVGVWLFRRRVGFLAFCLLPTLYFCALHLIFVSSVRYRIPTTPLMAILAGAAAAWLCVGRCCGADAPSDKVQWGRA
jgi:hypothetical protein